MSADNWTFFPQCLVNHEKSKDEYESKIKPLPLSDAEKLVLLDNWIKENVIIRTLRENFEYVSKFDGNIFEVYTSYECFCIECGFNENFDQTVISKNIN